MTYYKLFKTKCKNAIYKYKNRKQYYDKVSKE